MKYLFRIIIFVFSFALLNGQSPTDKGGYTIGGGISYSSSNRSQTNKIEWTYEDGSSNSNEIQVTTKTTNYGVYPSFNYFILPRLSIGLSFNSNLTDATNKYDDSKNIQKSKAFGFGPSVRYYITSKKIMPFVELAISTNQYKSDNKTTYFDNEDNSKSQFESKGNSTIFIVGFDYMISKNYAIEPYIRYSISNNDFDSNSEQHDSWTDYIFNYYSTSENKSLTFGLAFKLFIY